MESTYTRTYGQEDRLRNLPYSREVAGNGEINEFCPHVKVLREQLANNEPSFLVNAAAIVKLLSGSAFAYRINTSAKTEEEEKQTSGGFIADTKLVRAGINQH